MNSIETFANPNASRDYEIVHTAEEFTSLCPKTGHPDFGQIVLRYVPDELCIELKAYKIYLQSYRNKGIFYEALTNEIFNELWALLSPRWMRLESFWSGRGGLRSSICVTESQSKWKGNINTIASSGKSHSSNSHQ